MNVIITSEQRFYQTPDGAVWTPNVFPYSFWLRYVGVFETVKIAARMQLSGVEAQDDWRRVDGANVGALPIPYYLGPWQYVRSLRTIRQAVRSSFNSDDAVILRVPSPIGSLAFKRIRQQQRPFGIEMVGDPYDVFAPGAVKHPLRPFFRVWLTQRMKQICRHACAVAYVTEKSLQARYQPLPGTFTTHYSSIDLPDEAFAAEPRTSTSLSVSHEKTDRLIVTVGSLEQPYKGIHLLIDALETCRRAGIDLRLRVIGDGKYRADLAEQARTRGVQEYVQFLGMIPGGGAVRQQLDQADLFVLPSITEGLPRAMIEAMARALPCIGSTAGGIPELLAADDLVTPGDVAALARKIREVSGNPERMAQMSSRNLTKAKEYHAEILSLRRRTFYQHVKRNTELWLQEKNNL